MMTAICNIPIQILNSRKFSPDIGMGTELRKLEPRKFLCVISKADGLRSSALISRPPALVISKTFIDETQSFKITIQIVETCHVILKTAFEIFDHKFEKLVEIYVIRSVVLFRPFNSVFFFYFDEDVVYTHML